MFVQLMFRCAGLRRGLSPNPVGVAFMTTAIFASLLCLVSETLLLPDIVNRPFYQAFLFSVAYFVRIATYGLLYFWLLKQRMPLGKLANINSTDQFMFCFSFLCELHSFAVEIDYYLMWAKMSSTAEVTMIAGKLSYLFVALFGNATIILLHRLLRSVHDEISKSMETTTPLEEACTVIRRNLAEINAILCLPLMVLHAEYLIWSVASFACNIPALNCSLEHVLFIVSDAASTTILLLYVQSPGAAIAQRLRELRRRSHRQFLRSVSYSAVIKEWGPGYIVGLERSNSGITYDGVNPISWENVTKFFGVCWSTGFIMLPIAIASALENNGNFCSDVD